MKKRLICTALCALGVAVVFAQENPAEFSERADVLSLTVEDAVQYALNNSKSLKSAAIDLEIKKRAKDYSWNTFLPSLSASATAARTNYSTAYNSAVSGITSGAASAFAGGYTAAGENAAKAAYGSVIKKLDDYDDNEQNHWVLQGNVAAQWNFNLAMVESIKIAKNQYESGNLTWEQTSRETEVNIRKLFYGLLLQQENVSIQKESLSNAESRWRQAERLYNSGSVPRLQMLNARVTYENKKPEILNAENSLKQSKEMFAFLLGLSYGEDFELVGAIEFSYVDVNADELFRTYIDQNRDIQDLRKKKDLLDLSIRAKQLSTFTPSLSVNWNYNPTLYAMGEWSDSDLGIGEAKDGGALSFTLVYSNLFDMLPFSSNMQGIKDLKQQRTQLQLGMEQLYQNTEIEIHKLVDSLNVAKENIEAMERNVSIAQEAYESTLKSYNAGQTERLELQDSETQLNQAKLGLLSEKNNYISALLDLETKLNISLK